MKELNRLHLNGLRALEAVGRLGSLRRAAEELSVSVGAVSQQVIKAERQLGRAVFRRQSRQLVPSEYGQTLLPVLTEGFRVLARAVAVADARAQRILTISVAPVMAAKWLVPRLNGFRTRNPGIELRLDASAEHVDLHNSDVDACLRVGAGHWPGLDAELLMVQQIFPVCAPELARRLKRPADILAAPAVIDGPSQHVWDIWLRAAGLPAERRPAGYVFTDAALCLDAAIAGQGVMIAWQALAADALASGRLVAPIALATPSGAGHYLVTAPHRRREPKIARFRQWVKDEIALTAQRFPDLRSFPDRRSQRAPASNGTV